MIWEKIKTANQMTLDGVSIEIDKSDSTFVSATLTDAAGHKVRVRMDSYAMVVEVPAAPKMVDKFVVKGAVLGLPVNEAFDSEYQANDRKEELTGRIDRDSFDLAVAKEQVAEEIPF